MLHLTQEALKVVATWGNVLLNSIELDAEDLSIGPSEGGEFTALLGWPKCC